jgi:hypothetical protein
MRCRVLPEIDFIAGLTDYPPVPHDYTPDRILFWACSGIARNGKRPPHPVSVDISQGHFHDQGRDEGNTV